MFGCLLVVLFAATACDLGYFVIADKCSNTTSFLRDPEKDGLKCIPDFRVFNASTRSCTECAKECTQYNGECVGFFCKKLTSRCIGCRAGFDLGIAHYGAPCTSDEECPFTTTTCTELVCDCMAGYRREPKNKTCVVDCEIYGMSYTAHRGMRLAVTGEMVAKTVDECKAYCSSSPTCLGFNYANNYNYCGPKQQTPYTNPDDFNAAGNYDYYTRNCADNPDIDYPILPMQQTTENIADDI